MIALGDRTVHKVGDSFSQARIGEEIPNCRVRVGDGKNHQKLERGKLRNMSVRFRSISSADGGAELGKQPMLRRSSAPFG